MFPVRRFWFVLALILLAGAGLRAWIFLESRDWIALRMPILDAAYYDESARSLVAGYWPGDGPYFMGPLYTYFLAGVYAIFGSEVTAIRIVQMLLGLSIIALTAVVGRRLFGAGAGLAAGVLALLYGPLLFFEQMPLMETLFMAMSLLLFERSLVLRQIGRPGDALVVGLLVGALTAMRGTSLLYLFAVAAVVGRRQWRFGPAAVATAGIVLVLAPFTIHNLRAGSRSLLTTNLGLNLYVGQGSEASGKFRYPNGWRGHEDIDGRQFASSVVGKPLTADETNEFWLDQTRNAIAAAPGRTLTLALHKLYLFIQPDEIPQNENWRFFRMNVSPVRVALLGWWVVLPLALAGLFARGRVPRAGWVTLGYVIVPLATSIIFFVTSRYRLPAVPFLLVLAGAALSGAGSGSANPGERRRLRALCLSAAVAAVLLLLLPAPFDEKRALAREHANLGQRYQQIGAYRAAEEQFERALALDDGDGDTYNNYGALLVKVDRKLEALAAYEAAVRLLPTHPTPHLNLAALLGQAGRHADAEREFRRAHELDPHNVETLVNLGTSLALQDRLPEAIECYEKALELDPSNPGAREMLLMARDMRDALETDGGLQVPREGEPAPRSGGSVP